jgi:capsid protein
MTAILDQYEKPLPTAKQRGRDQYRVQLKSQYRNTLRAKYDSAQTTDENEKHWAQADGLSANAAINHEVRKKIRERARYEMANDSYAQGMQQTKKIAVIGSGPRPSFQLEDEDAAMVVQRRYLQWARSVNLAAKLRNIYGAYCGTDGEGFAVRIHNPDVPDDLPSLDYRLYEADQFASPFFDLQSTGYIDGVRLDPITGNPTSYTLLSSHPGDTFVWRNGVMEYETVEASRVLHLYRVDRPGQIRGVSHMAPALPLYAKRRRYALATITAAETAASLSAVLYADHNALTDEDIAAVEDDAFYDIPRGSMPVMPLGYKIGQLKSEHPSTTYEMFNRAIISEIARCFGMPYNIAAANSADMNYASGRLDEQGWRTLVDVERRWIEHQVMDRILSDWFDEAILIPGYLPDGLGAYTEGEVPHRWYWDPKPHVDPEKEATAFSLLWDRGAALDEDYIYETLGKDPAEFYKSASRQNEKRKQADMPLPGSGAREQPSQAINP